MAAAVVKDGVYVIKSMGTGYCLTEDSNTNEVYTGEGCFGIPEGTLGPEYLWKVTTNTGNQTTLENTNTKHVAISQVTVNQNGGVNRVRGMPPTLSDNDSPWGILSEPIFGGVSVSTFAAKDGNGNNVQLCLANDLEPQPAVIDGNNAVRVTLWDCDHNPRIVWNFIPTNATLML